MAADHEFAVALDRLVEHDYVRLVRAVALFSGTMDGAEDVAVDDFAVVAVLASLEDCPVGVELHVTLHGVPIFFSAVP